MNNLIDFDNEYSRDKFLFFLEEFLTDSFIRYENKIELDDILPKNRKILKGDVLGIDEELKLVVLEFKHNSEYDPRVTLSREAFKILSEISINDTYFERALAIFRSEKSKNYRLSLLKFEIDLDEKGKPTKNYSNPRRYSYFLGPEAKINTPKQFLLKKGKIKDFEDLESRFSVEVVNKEFYKEIAKLFNDLKKTYLKIDDSIIEDEDISIDEIKQNFAMKLIGRIIFIWFLKKKKSESGESLIPENLLSSSSVEEYICGMKNYYHEEVEPLFFEVLNTPIENRKEHIKEKFGYIPFLNGGLFEPKKHDFYKYDERTNVSKYYNELEIDNKWFKDFFEVLETYNFTIDENTPVDIELSIDPEMLGKIFENLLAEINPETQENARKNTGSYYTPKEIVNYMVTESIKLYLQEKTKISENILDSLLSYDFNVNENLDLSDEDKTKILNSLFELKVLDPACGSGAFPMGILHKIDLIYEKIDPDGTLIKNKLLQDVDPVLRRAVSEKFQHDTIRYIRKLEIIKNSIYGVDIQDIAVEIARLRFFLSLVIEEKIDEKQYNKGIEPLPNLDFKFVCADTLKKFDIDLDSIFKNVKDGLFNSKTINSKDDINNKDLISQLEDVIEEYFYNSEEKEQLKEKFYNIKSEMKDRLLFVTKKSSMKAINDFLKWDPFNESSSPWFNPKIMFGLEESFDIVIGNPPYIQLQKNRGELRKKYEELGYKTFNSMGDLYVLFIERGLELLNKNGILTYITSNKWLRASYGEKLRGYLSKEKNPIKLIDLGAGIFSSATVDTSILIVKNNKTKKVNLNAAKITSNEVNNIKNINFINIKKLNEDNWNILTPDELKIKEKIENIGVPLKDWDIKINYGIKTGYNKAFIIDGKTKDELISKDPKNAEIIKPLLRGRDIDRYKINFNDKWLINTHNGYGNIPRIDVEKDYPVIKEYLDKYIDELRKRQDQGDTPYNLRNCAYLDYFEKEKIIYREIVQYSSFAYDNNKYYPDATTFILVGPEIKYLLALLNSTLLTYAFKYFYSGGGLGEGFRYKKEYILKLPILRNPNEKIKVQIESLVDEILLKKKKELDTLKEEHDLDNIVYDLYGISKKEINIVEKASSIDIY
jgi:hypothetical protein